MWPYVLVASLVAVAAITGGSRRPDKLMWILFFILITIFVGLRHKVGMDWNNYLRMIEKAANAQTWEQLFRVAEPLYAVALLLGDRSGYGMYAVNLVCTVIFALGLFKFAQRTPEPWLALLAALPYYVIVVGMSANRQAVAAGVLMWLISAWQNSSVVQRVFWILVASSFHLSAILFLGFVGLEMKVKPWIKLIALTLFATLAVYILQTTGRSEYYDDVYGRGQTELTQSSGALFHVSLNAIPAALYFLAPRYRDLLFPTPILRQIAIAAIATFPLAFVASVAAGRITIYWFAMSIWVWSAIPSLVTAKSRPVIRLVLATLMVFQTVVWLMFGNSAAAHLPYRNALQLQDWQLHIGM